MLLFTQKDPQSRIFLLMASNHRRRSATAGLQPLPGKRMLRRGFLNAYHFRRVKHMKVIRGISFFRGRPREVGISKGQRSPAESDGCSSL